MPEHPGTFEERIKELQKIVRLTRVRWKKYREELPYPMNKLDCPVVCAKQIKVENDEHLDTVYKKIIANEGEGIMLKDPLSPYEGKRSNYLLKYKPAFDEEAIIVDHRKEKVNTKVY